MMMMTMMMIIITTTITSKGGSFDAFIHSFIFVQNKLSNRN